MAKDKLNPIKMKSALMNYITVQKYFYVVMDFMTYIMCRYDKCWENALFQSYTPTNKNSTKSGKQQYGN